MSMIRMNDSHRAFLVNLASSAISCAAEEKADKASYDRAMPMVRRLVEDKYPVRDMKLLAKYSVAHHDDCVKLQLTAGGVVKFTFRGDKSGPLVPSSYECRQRIYAADDKASEAVSAAELALGALQKARQKKMDDYRALISASVTLEQIEGVWPAAAALRERVGRALPVRLSDEVIARIRADAVPLKKAA